MTITDDGNPSPHAPRRPSEPPPRRPAAGDATRPLEAARIALVRAILGALPFDARNAFASALGAWLLTLATAALMVGRSPRRCLDAMTRTATEAAVGAVGVLGVPGAEAAAAACSAVWFGADPFCAAERVAAGNLPLAELDGAETELRAAFDAGEGQTDAGGVAAPTRTPAAAHVQSNSANDATTDVAQRILRINGPCTCEAGHPCAAAGRRPSERERLLHAALGALPPRRARRAARRALTFLELASAVDAIDASMGADGPDRREMLKAAEVLIHHARAYVRGGRPSSARAAETLITAACGEGAAAIAGMVDVVNPILPRGSRRGIAVLRALSLPT